MSECCKTQFGSMIFIPTLAGVSVCPALNPNLKCLPCDEGLHYHYCHSSSRVRSSFFYQWRLYYLLHILLLGHKTSTVNSKSFEPSLVHWAIPSKVKVVCSHFISHTVSSSTISARVHWIKLEAVLSEYTKVDLQSRSHPCPLLPSWRPQFDICPLPCLSSTDI